MSTLQSYKTRVRIPSRCATLHRYDTSLRVSRQTLATGVTMLSLVKKIVVGDNVRVSRLHDEAGNLCDVGAALGGFASAYTVALARVRGEWLTRPWWVWQAIDFVASELRAADKVLEIGSGYSSLWLAARCAHVTSVETSPEWLREIDKKANRAGRTNISLIHSQAYDGYVEAIEGAGVPDVLVIDSDSRRQIFEDIVCRTPQPRVVIYDDTDKLENRNLAAIASRGGFASHVFRGFKPQCIHVCETSVMIQKDQSRIEILADTRVCS